MEKDPLKIQDLRYVSVLYRNPHLFDTYADKLHEKHFAYPGARLLYTIIRSSYDNFGQVPAKEELEFLLDQELGKRKTVLIDADSYKEDLDDILNLEVTGVTEFELQTFIVSKELASTTLNLSNWKPEDGPAPFAIFREKLQELELLATKSSGLGFSPFSTDFLNDPKKIIKELYGGESIPTGNRELDRMLVGGFRPGELILLAGTPGTGKSLVMMNWALNAVFNSKKRIIYYAMDNTPAEMLERIWCNVGDTRIDELDNVDSEAWSLKIKEGAAGCHNNFWLMHYPPEAVSVRDIQRHLRWVRAMWKQQDLENGMSEEEAGQGPHMIFVDYGDIIKAPASRNEYRLELKSICDALARVAQEEKLVVVNGSQGNKEALDKPVVTLRNLAESFSKSYVASVVLAICQTSEEKAMDPPRLGLAVSKARRPYSNYVVYYDVDYGKMKISTSAHPVQRIVDGKLQDFDKFTRSEVGPQIALDGLNYGQRKFQNRTSEYSNDEGFSVDLDLNDISFNGGNDLPFGSEG